MRKCVCHPICFPAAICVWSVYMLFMSLTYMCPHFGARVLVCVRMLVCVLSVQAGDCDKVPVHFPRFTNHFHGLTPATLIPLSLYSLTHSLPCLCFHPLFYPRSLTLTHSLHLAHLFRPCTHVRAPVHTCKNTLSGEKRGRN